MTKHSITAAVVFPILLGAAMFGATVLFRTDSTPPWRVSSDSEPAVIQQNPALPRKVGETVPFTFVSYNVKNWLLSSQSPPKKPESKEAVIRILAGTGADVVGLCEVGSTRDVEEIRLMLAEAGQDLPYSFHTGGADGVRHLAVLSRYPILATVSPPTGIPGKAYSMQRGILDATVGIGADKVRFIGLHLKSKRKVAEFDQALLRIDEATHARKHIDGILSRDPGALVVAYGDFNDTVRSISTRTVFGTYRSPEYLAPVHVKDSRGESWTHCWAYENLYSRIDFVTVSKALNRRVDRDASRVVDDAGWETASDHRPVLVRFK